MRVAASTNKQLSKGHQAKKLKETLVGYSFILPHLISVLLFLVVPLLYSLAVSFYEFNLFDGFLGSEFIGLENYIRMFTDPKVYLSVFNNLKYMLGTIPTTICIAMLLAVLLNDKVFFKNGLRTLFFMPYISSIAAMSHLWMNIFSPKFGFINTLLRELGIDNPPLWLASEDWALPTLMLIAIWGGLGYCIVIYLGGLQAIDPSLYESSDIDGASFWQKLFKITIPLISPTTFFLIITSIIGSFQVFGSINIMTEGGPGTSTYVIAYYTYFQAFTNFDMGYASSISWLLMIIIMFVTVLQWYGQKKWVNY